MAGDEGTEDPNSSYYLGLISLNLWRDLPKIGWRSCLYQGLRNGLLEDGLHRLAVEYKPRLERSFRTLSSLSSSFANS